MTEVSISMGLCRLCHTKGHFRSLEARYTHVGKEITYSVILQDTFDIVLSQFPTNPSYSICGDCEVRLRDAALFKKQVLDCEDKFNSVYLQDGCIKIEIKEEIETHTEEYSEETINRNLQEDKYNEYSEETVNIQEDNNASNTSKEDIFNIDGYPLSLKSGQDSSGHDDSLDYSNYDKEITKFPCTFCNEQFENISLLQTHIKTHPGEKSCLLCTESFYTDADLTGHYGLKHGDGTRYPCTLCAKVYANPITLRKHAQIHFGNEFKCTESGKVFERTGEDFKSVETMKHFKCTFCEKEYKSRGHLNEHVLTHSGVKPYMCHICGKSFLLKTGLKRHIRRVHNNIKPAKRFSCDICKKSYNSKSYLIIHKRQHTGEKPYSCEVCIKSFASSKVLDLHKNLHSENNPYTCSYCERKFITAYAQKAHILRHIGEKPFSCEICGKKFVTRGSMLAHMRTHSDEKPFTCEVCKRTFREKCKLRRHIRMHAGIKPYTCKICDKKIAHLSAHMKVHSDVRSFGCDVCDKRFRRAENLKIHMRIHTGVKPYKCDVCCKCFNQLTTMKTHRKTHDKKGKAS